jgi:DNA-binding MarR family transcriptional regulator
MAIRRPNLSRSAAERADTGPTDLPRLAMDGFVTVRIVQLAEIISRGAAQVFEKQFGVKNTELRILVQLGGRESLAVNELARRTHVDKGWISRSLLGLQRRGLVGRKPHPTDTRASLVFLTPKGEELVARFAPVAQARNRRLLEGLNEAEVYRVLDGLLARAEDVLENPDLGVPAEAAPAKAARKPRRNA